MCNVVYTSYNVYSSKVKKWHYISCPSISPAVAISWCWAAGTVSLRPAWTSLSWNAPSGVSLMLATQEQITLAFNLNASHVGLLHYNALLLWLSLWQQYSRQCPKSTAILCTSVHIYSSWQISQCIADLVWYKQWNVCSSFAAAVTQSNADEIQCGKG